MRKRFEHISRFFCILSFLLLMLHEFVPHHHHYELLDGIHNLMHLGEEGKAHEHDGHHHHSEWTQHHDESGEHSDACNFTPQVNKQELVSLLFVVIALRQIWPDEGLTNTWQLEQCIGQPLYFSISYPLRGPPSLA